MAKRAVFLDRDGTVNVDKGYVYRVDDFEFLPYVPQAIKAFKALGYLVIVITNQSGVARGLYSEEDIETLHNHINSVLKDQYQTEIDAFYYCPHHPEGKIEKYKKVCECRKPSAGLFIKAIEDFDIDTEHSFAIGDSVTDVQAAQTIKIRSILIHPFPVNGYINARDMNTALRIVTKYSETDDISSGSGNPAKSRIHFIHLFDFMNTGDSICSPYFYFDQLFSRQRLCFIHNFSNINFDRIRSNDWVIIGGGGILDCHDWISDIVNHLLSISHRVISWGTGHKNFFDSCFHNHIHYSEFACLKVREYGAPDREYLPDVSCMNELFDGQSELKRHIGVIEHYGYPILEFKYDKISNAVSAATAIEFIKSSEIIITNTYHFTYWATLLGKKVILYNRYSSTIDYLKYPPVLYSGDLEKDILCAESHPDYLSECRSRNMEFAQYLLRQFCKIDDLYIEMAGALRKILQNKTIAVKGAGEHTSQLLMFFKIFSIGVNVAYIISDKKMLDFSIPVYQDIHVLENDVDAVIISSFIHRTSMKFDLKRVGYKGEIIDIYEIFEQNGMSFSSEFYDAGRLMRCT